METRETKLDATFKFGLYMKQMTGPAHPGLLHLFEQKYDDDVTFWYGIAEVACEPQDVQQLSLDPAFVIVVTLEDGRRGEAALVFMRAQFEANNRHVWIAISGRKSLEKHK